jgi:hypothetical protein
MELGVLFRAEATRPSILTAPLGKEMASSPTVRIAAPLLLDLTVMWQAEQAHIVEPI